MTDIMSDQMYGKKATCNKINTLYIIHMQAFSVLPLWMSSFIHMEP